MDLGEDGSVNVSKLLLKVTQCAKNPLVNNKGFTSDSLKNQLKQKLKSNTDQETVMSTTGLYKTEATSASKKFSTNIDVLLTLR